MKFTKDWKKVYEKIPHFEVFQKKLEEECKTKVRLSGRIRWDKWRFDKESIYNNGDVAITSWKGKDLIRIEFSPEILKEEKHYQSYVFLHEIGHIEQGHLWSIAPEKEEEIEKEEKEADGFAMKFFQSLI